MNKEREEIFQLFIKRRRLRFTDIQKRFGAESNRLAYHLRVLRKDGILKKIGEEYELTVKGESMIPFFKQLTRKEVGVLPVVLVAVTRGKQVLLLKRRKRPYQGYWGVIGGKLRLGETIQENALREVREETGLTNLRFAGVKAVVHERVKAKEFKHAFLLVFTEVRAGKGAHEAGEEGVVKWFSRGDALPRNIIPSDKWMLNAFLNKKGKVHEVLVKEKEGKIESVKLL